MRPSPTLLLLATLSLGYSLDAGAAPNSRVAALCKDQWPGSRGMQSYCIKGNLNDYDWIQYIRKRIYTQAEPLAVMDGCLARYAPDYHRALDCYWEGAE